MITIGDDGNIFAYFLVYVETCFPCAPVHVRRRIRDGVNASTHPESLHNPSEVQIDGAIHLNSGIVSYRAVAVDIVITAVNRGCKLAYVLLSMPKAGVQ